MSNTWRTRLRRSGWLGVLRLARPRRSTVQLMLSIGGMALLCVAGLLVSVVLGVVLAGLACFALEQRIGRAAR